MADASATDVKFTEAIEYLRRMLAIDSDEWQRILAEEGATSSAIADDTVRTVVENLAAAVADQLENGGSLAGFRKEYERIVQEAGWTYHGDPQWHSELIWRLHTGNAFAAGRWEQAQRSEQRKPGTVFGRLVTAGDTRVRHTHAEMHGIIRPINDPYWQTHWPPNGFNCRCHVMVITQREMKRFSWTVTPDGDPRLSVPPDPGWGFNPGVIGQRLRQVERAEG